MPAQWSCTWPCPSPVLPLCTRRGHGFRCCSTTPSGKSKESRTPLLLRSAVSGVTELLRLFYPASQYRMVAVDNEQKDDVSVSNVNDVLSIIKSDYEKAYFVTGLFTSGIYTDDCTFEDPTIKFQGRDLYARNLSLLINFFDSPSIQLKEINKDVDSEAEIIVASWKLRTCLKLPWKPLISIDGRTIYYLDEELRIFRHVEKWNVSAFEAILQIFTSSAD